MFSRRAVTIVLSLYIMFVFVQSLFFKFTGSPETDHIFNTLEAWAVGLGASGLFVKQGVFGPYVIGSAELVASILLLAGLVLSARFTAIGALMAMGIISGAILFHLFTPLGVAVTNADGSSDGGLLFGMAVGVWISAAILTLAHRRDLPLIGRVF